MRSLPACLPSLLSVAIVLASSSALATPVTLLSQERTIDASATGCSNFVCDSDSQGDAATTFGLFDSSVLARAPHGSGSASQLSLITASVLSASVRTSGGGSAEDSFNQGRGSGGALFRASIAVSDLARYSIQGSHSTFVFDGPGSASVSLSLVDGLGTVLWSTSGSSGTGSVPFDAAGVLAPGSYVFEARASASGQAGGTCCGGYGEAGFDFDLVLVPEPSTALALGLGLVLLASSRRGRRSARPMR